jgi:hypothetical protein
MLIYIFDVQNLEEIKMFQDPPPTPSSDQRSSFNPINLDPSLPQSSSEDMYLFHLCFLMLILTFMSAYYPFSIQHYTYLDHYLSRTPQYPDLLSVHTLIFLQSTLLSIYYLHPQGTKIPLRQSHHFY